MASTTEMYFSQFWRLESSKSRCQWSKFNSEASLLDLQIVPCCWALTRSLLCVCGGRERELKPAFLFPEGHWSYCTSTPPLWLCVCCVLSCFCCVWLFVSPWTEAHQPPLSMAFSRQEYWSGLPCPPPGGLPHPRVQPAPFMSPASQAGTLPLVPPGKPLWLHWTVAIPQGPYLQI